MLCNEEQQKGAGLCTAVTNKHTPTMEEGSEEMSISTAGIQEVTTAVGKKIQHKGDLSLSESMGEVYIRLSPIQRIKREQQTK